MRDPRREPYRLLFPVAALLAWVGVAPWVLLGAGLSRAYLGTFHALTLTQGFLVAAAAGFLGTMVPRRTGGAPMSGVELGALAATLATVPAALYLDAIAVAEAAYLVALGVLARFAVTRLRRSAQPVPASFVMIPLGLAAGIVGSASLLASTVHGAPAFTLPVGRMLVEEGVLLPFVLALAPMLSSLILSDKPPTGDPRAAQLAVAAALVAGYVLQAVGDVRVGTFTRGAAALVEVLLVADVARAPAVPGLHRRVFQLAMLLVPVGLLAAALVPVHRLAFLHVTFVGGLSLLVFAVSFHVTFLHTGREALATARPWPVAVVAATTLAATLVRATAEHTGTRYVEALGIAASLWLAGALVWGVWLLALVTRGGREHPSSTKPA